MTRRVNGPGERSGVGSERCAGRKGKGLSPISSDVVSSCPWTGSDPHPKRPHPYPRSRTVGPHNSVSLGHLNSLYPLRSHTPLFFPPGGEKGGRLMQETILVSLKWKSRSKSFIDQDPVPLRTEGNREGRGGWRRDTSVCVSTPQRVPGTILDKVDGTTTREILSVSEKGRCLPGTPPHRLTPLPTRRRPSRRGPPRVSTKDSFISSQSPLTSPVYTRKGSLRL